MDMWEWVSQRKWWSKELRRLVILKVINFISFVIVCLRVLFQPGILLSGHSDENALVELLLTYKVLAHVPLVLNLSMMLLLHGGKYYMLQLVMSKCRH
jgi:hypothetical protein